MSLIFFKSINPHKKSKALKFVTRSLPSTELGGASIFSMLNRKAENPQSVKIKASSRRVGRTMIE